MTITYSWLSAFFILCPLLMLIGPEGSFGEIGFLKRLFKGSSGDQDVAGWESSKVVVKPSSVEVRTVVTTAGGDFSHENDIDRMNEAEI
jgi:hypothetical protein